jgi:amidase
MQFQLEEVTILELQQAMTEGQITAKALTDMYIERIRQLNQDGPRLNAVIEVNPDALEIAARLDEERVVQGVRGPLHGIPLLLKDNIATLDKMQTTAGSLALVGARPARDAVVAQQLRAAGAILLGKSNMSEWANFRSSFSSSGWSARGGQARNPYVLDRTPCGSSSGSATAIAANLAAASLGTETDGSILCPAGMCGVVGIKPTVGLTSRSGVIPIAHSQDTVGPFGRTVTDAAIVLGALTGVDPLDVATQHSEGRSFIDYTKSLDVDGLKGARIGVCRAVYFGYSPKTDMFIEAAIQHMRAMGAIIVDPADIPTAKQMAADEDSETTVLLYELKADMNNYLSELSNTSMQTLADLIAFNEANAHEELRYFGQDLFLRAQETTTLDDSHYLEALARNQRLSRVEGIDAVMNAQHLDALVMPTVGPAWCIDHINGDHYSGSCTQPAALAGYPAISVPAGFVSELPVGITFMGGAFSEPTLIRLAYAFEQSTMHRRRPKFLPTIETFL